MSALEQLRALARELDTLNRAATPAPWERGDRYHVQAARFCECLPEYGPLVSDKRMDINGEKMRAHVHRAADPWWKLGIYAVEDGEPVCVAVETTEYGGIGDDDAALILWLRNHAADILALVEQAQAKIRELEAELNQLREGAKDRSNLAAIFGYELGVEEAAREFNEMRRHAE